MSSFFLAPEAAKSVAALMRSVIPGNNIVPLRSSFEPVMSGTHEMAHALESAAPQNTAQVGDLSFMGLEFSTVAPVPAPEQNLEAPAIFTPGTTIVGNHFTA